MRHKIHNQNQYLFFDIQKEVISSITNSSQEIFLYLYYLFNENEINDVNTNQTHSNQPHKSLVYLADIEFKSIPMEEKSVLKQLLSEKFE